MALCLPLERLNQHNPCHEPAHVREICHPAACFTTKPPEGEKGGICGPTVVVLLAMLVQD